MPSSVTGDEAFATPPSTPLLEYFFVWKGVYGVWVHGYTKEEAKQRALDTIRFQLGNHSINDISCQDERVFKSW